MANNNFNLGYNTPDLTNWSAIVNQRNDIKNKETRDNLMNTMKMLGIMGAMGDNETLNPSEQDLFESKINVGWSDLSPEDQISLINAGYNPSLFTNKWGK